MERRFLFLFSPSSLEITFLKFGLPDGLHGIGGDSQFLASRRIPSLPCGSQHHDLGRGELWFLPDALDEGKTVHPVA